MTSTTGPLSRAAQALALPSGTGRRVLLLAVVPFFVFAGVNHFLNPAFYRAMMPPYLPAHDALIAISGAFEILGGVGVLVPRLRRAAGWGLILLLLAVFPANLHMALHPESFPDIPTVGLYGRLPFQVVFIVWVWWATGLGQRGGHTVPPRA